MVVETITQFVDHVKIRLISQLIKGISRVLQKCFVPVSPVLPVTFTLKLNESVRLFSAKLTIPLLLVTAGISIQYCHKLPDVFE